MTAPSWRAVLTMRDSASLYSLAGLSRPRSVISASPRMTVVGVRSSWLMSAKSLRRCASAWCSEARASASSRVRVSTCTSSRWRCADSRSRCCSSSAASALTLPATSANSSWPASAMRWPSRPACSARAPSLSCCSGRCSARPKCRAAAIALTETIAAAPSHSQRTQASVASAAARSRCTAAVSRAMFSAISRRTSWPWGMSNTRDSASQACGASAPGSSGRTRSTACARAATLRSRTTSVSRLRRCSSRASALPSSSMACCVSTFSRCSVPCMAASSSARAPLSACAPCCICATQVRRRCFCAESWMKPVAMSLATRPRSTWRSVTASEAAASSAASAITSANRARTRVMRRRTSGDCLRCPSAVRPVICGSSGCQRDLMRRSPQVQGRSLQ